MAYDEFELQLRALDERGRYRRLHVRTGVDFTSNDYLGLAESDELDAADLSSPDWLDCPEGKVVGVLPCGGVAGECAVGSAG